MFTKTQLEKKTKSELIKLLLPSPKGENLFYFSPDEDLTYPEMGAFIEAATEEGAFDEFLSSCYDPYDYDEDEEVHVFSVTPLGVYSRSSEWKKR